MRLCLEKAANGGAFKMTSPAENHLKAFEDLVTPYEETRAGFVALALEKSRKAIPFIEEAKSLKALAGKASKPEELLNIQEIQRPLLTASGVSDKASSYMNDQDKKAAVLNLIENFLEPSGKYFTDELVYRFLLTKGDAVGGVIRNFAGAAGERKFTRYFLSLFSLQGRNFEYLNSRDGKWIQCKASLHTQTLQDDLSAGKKIKGLHWRAASGASRVLIYNLTVPFIKKNVDLCLFCCSPKEITFKKSNSAHHNMKKYLALGELKGGIDPAGADEHWKTANAALERIRKAFLQKNRRPHTFFIGAAIEKSMAKEIYQQLNRGILTNGANLTSREQVMSLCKWLTDI